MAPRKIICARIGTGKAEARFRKRCVSAPHERDARAVEVARWWPCSQLLRTLRPLKSAPVIFKIRIRNRSFRSAAIIAVRQSDAARSFANGITLHTRISRYWRRHPQARKVTRCRCHRR